ncbi:tetratricopeptide repeat protein [Pseudoteredinibacter isoporae]|uniref:tetratricopeptide repeat protein n=1 Tax=Pseudoteredinibacter isoporae TaxID=570281 RepID=UPI00333E4C7C
MKMTAAATKFVKHTLLAAPLMLAPAVSSVVMKAFNQDATFGAVYAQEATKKPPQKTRKTPALSQKVFKKLEAPNQLINPEQGEPDYRGALKLLNEINTDKFNKYEKAQVYNLKGFAYYSLEDYRNAIKEYKLLLAQSPQIPLGLEVQITYTVGQLQFVLEDYDAAEKTIEKWMSMAPIIGADAHALLGQIYYTNKKPKKAIKSINTAVGMYDKKGKTPKENWFQILSALHYEVGDNKKVIGILERLVRLYPKQTYWRRLAGMYGLDNREKDQLYAYDAVYQMGGLTKEKELMNLAYLYMGEDVPYLAAKVLKKGLADKIIEPTSKNLEVYATALRMSQEIKKSIPVMEQAASKSDSGDLFARLAGIYLDSDNNTKAVEVGEKALKRGGVKRKDQLYITLGMATANQKKYTSAIKFFKEAAKDKRSKKFATGWIKYCQNELERERKLAAS